MGVSGAYIPFGLKQNNELFKFVTIEGLESALFTFQ